MPILIKAILGAGGSFVSMAVSGLLKLIVSEKVVMKITMSILKKLAKSSKNSLDDEILITFEEAYKKAYK
jgi:hypothetical protein